ncbi:MAG: TetR family transcriptional regulator [Oceanospirillaceae bacterium]|mgnify:CR=1 FL=1|nr:TetR family transcriptional regulator [Oceanospirillaceae bacterium]MBT12782.1 TetR family transcriptional regulator [Oceanospirillaceae bacterium]|tara:strand:+ start:50756 stop:51334 length:579 start_codon:yes stop_codon:yes gene_type:complete
MGRRKTIDRNVLLDIAEQIVGGQGAKALTIDALAKAAGITKGGVQYSFRNKEALLDAIFERWDQQYNSLYRSIAGDHPDAMEKVAGHVQATRQADESANARAASLMMALLENPKQMAANRTWYRGIISDLDLSDEKARRMRLAFLASEGAFLLRSLGLLDIDDSEWQDMMDDVATTLLPGDDSGRQDPVDTE